MRNITGQISKIDKMEGDVDFLFHSEVTLLLLLTYSALSCLMRCSECWRPLASISSLIGLMERPQSFLSEPVTLTTLLLAEAFIPVYCWPTTTLIQQLTHPSHLIILLLCFSKEALSLVVTVVMTAVGVCPPIGGLEGSIPNSLHPWARCFIHLTCWCSVSFRYSNMRMCGALTCSIRTRSYTL